MNVFLITTILAVAVGFGAGYRTASNAADARELVAQRQAQERYHSKEIDYNTAAVNLEQARATLAAQRSRTASKVQEVAARPSYQRDCLDADGVRLINEAIGRTTTPSESSGRVPSSNKP